MATRKIKKLTKEQQEIKRFIAEINDCIASEQDYINDCKKHNEDSSCFVVTQDALILYKALKLCKPGTVTYISPADLDCFYYIEGMDWSKTYPLKVVSLETFTHDDGEQDIIFNFAYREDDDNIYVLDLTATEIESYIFFFKEDCEAYMKKNSEFNKKYEEAVRKLAI